MYSEIQRDAVKKRRLPDMRGALPQSISEYFDGWIKDNLRYADGLE